MMTAICHCAIPHLEFEIKEYATRKENLIIRVVKLAQKQYLPIHPEKCANVVVKYSFALVHDSN